MHRYAKFMSSSWSAASFTIRCFGATLAHGAPRVTDILYALPSCISPHTTHVTFQAWERLADARPRGSNAHTKPEPDLDMISRIEIEPCRAIWLTCAMEWVLITERWYGAERESCDDSCLGEPIRRTISTIKYSHHARAGRGA